MEIVISKSTNKNKKFDAIVDGKKYHLGLLVIVITLYTKTLNAKNDTFHVMLSVKIGINQE